MALSFFCDALPFSEMSNNYSEWFDNIQISPLMPNIAYSSSLHWQLYCDKYPDDRGVLLDWTRIPDENKMICFLSSLLRPLDFNSTLGWLSRKFLDRVVFRRNAFANIPYKFRGDFSQKAKYLFWDFNTYHNEELFRNYMVVSQDEGHLTFEESIKKLNLAIDSNTVNIFCALGFADAMGHKCKRGEEYSKRLKKYMDVLKVSIQNYIRIHPNEPVLIVSDHGMSTVKNRIDLKLEEKFGKQSNDTYVAYLDSCFMCIWSDDQELLDKISLYLESLEVGHLLSEQERIYYKSTDKTFGDLIYILREGNVFSSSWFGIGKQKNNPDGSGMHGHWPEESAKDQIASIILINSQDLLKQNYNYEEAYHLIKDVMEG